MEFPDPDDRDLQNFLRNLPEIESLKDFPAYQELSHTSCASNNALQQLPKKATIKKRHWLDSIPEDQKPFKCPYQNCTRSFLDIRNLEAHIPRDHFPPKPFPCTHQNCDAAYDSKRNLDYHLKGHEKPRKCKHCSQFYASLIGLKNHERRCNFIGNRKKIE